MRFYIVRHANPEESDVDPDDPDPPLTDEGKEMAAALGQWMLDQDEVPNSFLVSPKLRCQETAEILRETLGLPEACAQIKGSIDSDMSIREMVLKACADKSMSRVAIVSHHESIEHGLRVLNREPWIHLDMLCECELRILRVDRGDGTWKEKQRVMPSDLGLKDYY